MHGSTPARLLVNGERAQATSVPLSLSVTSADVFSAEHCLGDAEKTRRERGQGLSCFSLQAGWGQVSQTLLTNAH